jgi:hypothetical protein
MGLNSRRVAILLRCVNNATLTRESIARSLAWGVRDAVGVGELVDFVQQLRDSTQPEVDWALLDALHRWWLERPGERSVLLPIVIAVLLNTIGHDTPTRHNESEWDMLAAEIARLNPKVGFELLFAHVGAARLREPVVLEHDRARLIEALSQLDRPRFVDVLLTTTLKSPQEFALRFDLPTLLNPETDFDRIVEFVRGNGQPAAKLVASSLDADHPRFWERLETIADRYGSDPDVRVALLQSVLAIRKVYSDSGAVLHPRLKLLRERPKHHSPWVRDVVRRAIKGLEKEMARGW